MHCHRYDPLNWIADYTTAYPLFTTNRQGQSVLSRQKLMDTLDQIVAHCNQHRYVVHLLTMDMTGIRVVMYFEPHTEPMYSEPPAVRVE